MDFGGTGEAAVLFNGVSNCLVNRADISKWYTDHRTRYRDAPQTDPP